MRDYERKEPTIGPLPGFAGEDVPKLALEPERNIGLLQQSYEKEEARDGKQPAIIRAVGSGAFVFLQALIFVAWIVCNLKWIPGVPAWDPNLVILAIVASVEAVFLVIFVLMAQNRMAAAARRRARLQLEINLVAEQERAKLTRLVSAMATHMNIDIARPLAVEKPQNGLSPEHMREEEAEFAGPSDEF